MTIEELLNNNTNNLNELDTNALKWMLVELLEISNSEYYLIKEQQALPKIIRKYKRLVKKYLTNNIPVQQLLGYSYFYGNKYLVNKHTLIPRNETELLIEKVYEKIKSKYHSINNLNILDLGTGSGVIAIEIKRLTKAFVSASDISKNALRVAKKNAKNNNLNINFICSNWFNNISGKYDVIISNPPYIKTSFKLDEKVLNEPKNALFSGIEGLDSYKTIIKEISNHLNDSFIFAFEHAYDQSELIINLINENFSNVKIETIKDYNNLDRIIIVSR